MSNTPATQTPRNSKQSTPDPVPLLREAAQCGRTRRSQLHGEVVRQHLPLASGISSRYTGRGIPAEDLRQVAHLGLVKAVQGFDILRGEDFLAYAVPTIRGEIRRHFRDAGWTVRPPRRIQELQSRLWAADADLRQRLQRGPTTAELAEEIGTSEPEVREALSAEGCFTPTSLDASAPDHESGGLIERMGGDDPGFASAEARLIVEEAIKNLDQRDRTIVWLRFYEGWTQEQIGRHIGVTQMQVSRLLSRVFEKLRALIEDEIEPLANAA